MLRHGLDVPLQPQIHCVLVHIWLFGVIAHMEKPFRRLRVPYQHMPANHDGLLGMLLVPVIEDIQGLFRATVIQFGNLNILPVYGYCVCTRTSAGIPKHCIRLQFITYGHGIKMLGDKLHEQIV